MATMQATPRPHTLTLRFKQQRTTILLEVEPLQKLSEIRALLLHAIQQTHQSGNINGQDIPQNSDQVKLGKAVDRHNLKLGFTSLDKELPEEAPTGKGKGKVSATNKSATSQLKDCPQGVGLKSGDVVAFKFADQDEAAMVDMEGEIVEKWDVSIPTLEEAYGDEGGDEGVGLEEG
ncbi:hypothetical protein CLAFUW4_04962 [Fulvia fulva]|uniref:Uncharacterized protein n=1 Tax=Passalora fulva TaxID=5499 RepID=A0A9Q8UUU2_PASFU|nr:uncharacterized protein CLAFUR5_11944 [Fulvia fulva]KAK4626405.1 hypothetical protein CLAFUR4_04948 [Fulvia fulva]KAK4628472.1 hypothetical protein CLAFUR0_04952 [Fulvia fulva]UJO23245.1 hypothetical protein CLAFUR5_11944 [Fulvia fulva]WPV13836.1 hypothetical protein CLAFUW4_04962 [Fulvia fulva]WPV28740.1 hypothetical protein CLAFUW7_04956 [Fulvia fulva]